MREDRTPGGRHRHRSLQDHRPKKQQSREEDTNGMPATGELEQGEESKEKDANSSQENYIVFINKIREKAIIIPSLPSPEDNEDSAGMSDLNKLMQYAYQELYQVIQWSKDVPGFREIDLEDQVCLLKAAFMDLNVFRLAYRSVPCDPMSLMFGKDLICDRKTTLEFGWTDDLIDTTLEFVDKLRSLNLDPNEFACLSALALFSPGLCPHVLF